mmetsp:Transcript_16079/g.30907  ORF Transcript_16079/g.30907 Transcript_16079/m.30907 type:complete len:226 (-) Transcript_16079:603-1280(-)
MSGKTSRPWGGKTRSGKRYLGPRRTLSRSLSRSSVALRWYRSTHERVQKPQAGPSLHDRMFLRMSSVMAASGGTNAGCLLFASTLRLALSKAMCPLARSLRRPAPACGSFVFSLRGLSQLHILGTSTGGQVGQLGTKESGGLTRIAPSGMSPLDSSSAALVCSGTGSEGSDSGLLGSSCLLSTSWTGISFSGGTVSWLSLSSAATLASSGCDSGSETSSGLLSIS